MPTQPEPQWPLTVSAQLVESSPGYVNTLEVPAWAAEAILAHSNPAAMGASKTAPRVEGTINGVEIHLALQLRPGQPATMMCSKALQKQAGIRLGQPVTLTLRPERNPLGMPMPEDLQAALELEPAVYDRFHALPMGRRRALMHMVASAKTVDTRVNRAMEIFRRLEAGDLTVGGRTKSK